MNVYNRWLGCSPDAKLMFLEKLVSESPNAHMNRDNDLMVMEKANKNWKWYVNSHQFNERSLFQYLNTDLKLAFFSFPN